MSTEHVPGVEVVNYTFEVQSTVVFSLPPPSQWRDIPTLRMNQRELLCVVGKFNAKPVPLHTTVRGKQGNDWESDGSELLLC